LCQSQTIFLTKTHLAKSRKNSQEIAYWYKTYIR
jgi:hypothetical protein